MKREIKFHRGYVTARNEFGHHGPHVLFIVSDERATVVLDAHTGWYQDEPMGSPYATIAWHKPIGPHTPESEMHECEYVVGGTCESGQCCMSIVAGEFFREFWLSGEDWLFEKLEAFHASIVDGTAPPTLAPTRRLVCKDHKLVEESDV